MKHATVAREPNILGDFVLGEKLGEGGFGTVYRAEQRTLGRPAVVKVIRHALVTNRDVADRFALEARLASRFDHPYAAHVYAFGIEPDGLMWIAMELVKGTPLDQLVERGGPIALERFVPLMERICDVVQTAHEQQIIHRDIKPSNVMIIARAGRLMPKLLDFGIAKTLNQLERPLVAALPTTALATTSVSGARAKRPSEVGRLGLDLTLAVSESLAQTVNDARNISAEDAPGVAPGASDVAPGASDVAPDATAATAASGLMPRSLETDHTAASDSSPRSASDAPGASSSLTRVGQILGSPPYMAPEQWVDAGDVGPWTDQYAIGLLAYEAIVGKRAFHATSVEAYLYLHATESLPALPDHFPPGLHAVLARATAKDSAQRFGSLTELANAFREAALEGATTSVDGPVIALPPALRATWMDKAPTPIAEAIAAIATARTPSRVAERARGAAAVLARWFGVVALACQSRVGRLVPGSSAHELVLAARRRALRDVEWLELAAALVQPFVERPETWPIPELVGFLDDRRLATLRGILDDVPPAANDSESAMRTLAEDCVAKLAMTLEDAAWLLEYELARTTERGLEIWTGVAGEDRAVRSSGRVAPTGSEVASAIVVLDADGAPVVQLSPLVQVAAPLPGQRDEVFIFSGPSRDRQTSRGVAYPRGYERDDQETWAWFASHLLELDDRDSISLDEERSPYPGLAAFTGDDHASFVGREAEVEELVNRLRDQHLVAVVGPSGVGKSSFLAAGVLPLLPGGWRAATIRPAATPIAALRALVERTDAPYRDGPRHEVPQEPAALADAIVAIAHRLGSTFVIVVDQAEELFTMCPSEAERESFAAALTTASASEQVRIVLSLRDDFLVRVDELVAWRGRLARGVQVLRMPGPRDLQRSIAVPARRCGYDFDDPTLPDSIVADVGTQPGALPLVAFAAAELWQRRDRHFKRLTRKAYEEIGGVTGALVQHADGIVDRMPAAERRLVRLAFRRLLTTEGTRALIGRNELVAGLGEGTDGERVIERLLAARLVVSRDDDGGERIEIIHESLATTWPRLAAWRHEDAASTKMQERLAAAARHWDERGRPVTLLWRGAVLDDLARLEREGITRNPLERAFAAQSVLVARRTRRRTIAAILAAFGVLAAGLAVLAWANRRISTQRETAIERLAASFEERGRLAIEEGDAPRATLYLTESRRLGARGPGGDLLIAHAAAALEAERELIGHTESPITLAQIEPGVVLALGSDGTLRRWQGGTPTLLAEDVSDATAVGETVVAIHKRGSLIGYGLDGKRAWQVEGVAMDTSRVFGNAASGLVVTSGASTKLWSVKDGATRGELATQGAVRAATFDASGTRVATGGMSGSVDIFEVATGKLLARCSPHTDRVNQLLFTPDGSSLVTGSADREIRVCDPATGNLRHRLRGHRNKISVLALSRDARVVVSGSRDGGVFIWDLDTGLALVSLALGSSPKSIELSPDGKQLATTARDGSVRIWDGESGAAIGSLQGHGGVVSQTFWDGSQIVTASLDGSIRRWDVTRASRALFASHGAAILDFDLVDGVAVTGGADGRVIVWNHETREPVATLVHGTAVNIARLAPDLRTVATVDAIGAVALWSLADHRRITTVTATGVARAAFLPDGTLVTSHADGALRWWHADGRAAGHVELGFRAAILTVDPAGRWLAASPDFMESGQVALIDLSSRRLATKLPSQSRNLVAFGRDRLALSRGAIVELVELGTWRRLGELQGHRSNVTNLWYLPDGRLLTAGDDAKLVAWSPSGQLLQTLATGGDIMLDVETSPDGTLLAAIGYEGTLRLFDTASLQRLLALPGHLGFSTYLQFTRDGSRVVSGGNDGRIVSWDVRHPTRSLEDLTTLVRCRVPLRLEGDIAVPRKLDLDDPSCDR